MGSIHPTTLADLADHRYLGPTTFRRHGRPIPTTIWFVVVDGDVVFTMVDATGTFKHLRHTPRMLIATPGESDGAIGPAFQGQSHLLDGAAAEQPATPWRGSIPTNSV